ncbi:helix-turn-helix domain-containing protein, partial [Streptomyces sp. NPDC059431]|uniref:TetR/AcrR family transcriptional regulator n=1 Tax=Streptomyces sp. NPDC059431 TaxID=3346828 RepID=UPI0036754202
MDNREFADSETLYETASDTRKRILRVSMELFAVRGFHDTSLREIAERVGVSKPAVLYHFPGKADILGALVEPMLRDLAAAVSRAADAGSGGPSAAAGSGGAGGPAGADQVRWAAIEGVLDTWLSHRHLVRLNLQDMAMATPGPAFARLRDAMLRANALVAGADPGFAERVRAAQAIAMLSDPVILFADAPVADLRAAVLDGVRRLLDGPSEHLPATAAAGGAR